MFIKASLRESKVNLPIGEDIYNIYIQKYE